MSKLIDQIIYEQTTGALDQVNVGDKWYIAKAHTAESRTNLKILNRIVDAFKVLTGKSFAYHYAVDDKQLLKQSSLSNSDEHEEGLDDFNIISDQIKEKDKNE